MREIHFRAFSKGEMHEGVQPLMNGKSPTHVMVPDGIIQIYEPTGNKRFWYEIEVEAVMQSTGLKDKNGIEAYEGDIIEHSTTEGGIFRRVLSYSEELCTLMVDDMPYYRLHESGYIQPSKLEFEIVGNIFQSPDK